MAKHHSKIQSQIRSKNCYWIFWWQWFMEWRGYLQHLPCPLTEANGRGVPGCEGWTSSNWMMRFDERWCVYESTNLSRYTHQYQQMSPPEETIDSQYRLAGEWLKCRVAKWHCCQVAKPCLKAACVWRLNHKNSFLRNALHIWPSNVAITTPWLDLTSECIFVW